MGDRLGEAWERLAAEWTAWARTPGHDLHFTRLNWPAFERLLPAPGRLALDLGCGEGRLGRLLNPAGYRLIGLDSSPTLAALARDSGGYDRVLEADACAIPLDDGAVDLVIAFMSLHDMDDPAAAIAETARVLEPGGLLCAAIVHPFNRPADRLVNYFENQRATDTVETNGLTRPSTRSTGHWSTTRSPSSAPGSSSRHCGSHARTRPRWRRHRGLPRRRSGRSSCTCAAAVVRSVAGRSPPGPEDAAGRAEARGRHAVKGSTPTRPHATNAASAR
jgi:SAM-dependent methyltransferase